MDNQIKFSFESFFATSNQIKFLSIHIHQHMIIIISIANGTLSFLLMCLIALSAMSHVGTFIPICAQQFLAKGHLKNRCLKPSTFCNNIVHNHKIAGIYSSFEEFFSYSTCSLVKANRKLYVFADRPTTKST
jgi:hypothetical protein